MSKKVRENCKPGSSSFNLINGRTRKKLKTHKYIYTKAKVKLLH